MHSKGYVMTRSAWPHLHKIEETKNRYWWPYIAHLFNFSGHTTQCLWESNSTYIRRLQKLEMTCSSRTLRATSHMTLRAHDHYTSSTLIGVKRAELVQVRFTLHLRDQQRMWMQDDGCKVYMASYMAPNGSCFMITWIIFKNHLLGGMPNTKLGDHGTPNADDCWFILLYHVWRPAWMEIHWNSIRLRARSHMTSHYTWGSVTTLHDFGGVLGWPLGTFFWALTISWSRLLARVGSYNGILAKTTPN